MVELERSLGEYVKSDVLFVDRLLDRLIRELNLSELERGLYLYGEKLAEAENVLWKKLSEATEKRSYLEAEVLFERAVGQLAESFDFNAEEVFIRKGLPTYHYLALVHVPKGGLSIAIYAGVADVLLDLETKNVVPKLVAKLGGKLKDVKTEEDLWAFFKKHSNLLEELYVDESKSFESFIEAIKEVEDRIAKEVRYLNPQALTSGLKKVRR